MANNVVMAASTSASASGTSTSQQPPASTRPPAAATQSANNMQQQQPSLQQQQPSINMQALKSSLYQKLSTDGMLSQVKANVRAQLLQQLTRQQQQSNGSSKPADQQSLAKVPLLQRAVNSLIAEYLQCNSLHYSYSVFTPEVSLNNTSQLSTAEICGVLKLNAELTEQLTAAVQPATTAAGTTRQSLLTALLQHLHTLLAPTHNKHPISTQTDQSELSLQRPSLDTLLQNVDDLYEQKRHNQQLVLHDQQRASQLQLERDLQQKYEQLYATKLDQYKETELNAMKMQERQRYTTQLDAELRQLQQQYDDKYTNLKQREQQLEVEQRQLQMKNETTRYEERQKLLEDMQRLQSKELELQRSNNLLQKELEFEKQSWAEKHRLLDLRLAEVETSRREFDVKLENEKKLLQLEHKTTVKALKEQITDLNQTLQRLQSRHSSTSQSFDDAHSQITKLLSDITAEKQLSQQQEQSLRQTTNELQAAQQQLKELTFEVQHYRKLDSIITSKSGDVNVIGKQIESLTSQLSEQQQEHEHRLKQLKAEHQREVKLQHDAAEDMFTGEQRKYTQLLYEWQHTCDTLQAELQAAKREEEELHRQIDDLTSQLRQQRRVATTLQQQMQQRPLNQAELLNSSSLMPPLTRPHTAGGNMNASFLNTSMPMNLNTSALYGSTGLNTTATNFQPYTAYTSATPHHKQLADRRSHSLDESTLAAYVAKQDRSAEVDADLYARQQALERLEMEERTLKNEFDALVSQQHLSGRRQIPAPQAQYPQYPPVAHQPAQPLQPYSAAVQQPYQQPQQLAPAPQPQPQLPTPQQVIASIPPTQVAPQPQPQAAHPQPAHSSAPDDLQQTPPANAAISTLQQQQKSAPASPAKKHVAQIAEKAKQLKAQQAATASIISRPTTAHTRVPSFEATSDNPQLNEERERAREERRAKREQDKRQRERTEALDLAAKIEAERLERERFEHEYAQRTAAAAAEVTPYHLEQSRIETVQPSSDLPGLKPAGNTIDEFLETSYDQLFPGDSANLLLEELKVQEPPAKASVVPTAIEDEFQSLHDETEASQQTYEDAF